MINNLCIIIYIFIAVLFFTQYIVIVALAAFFLQQIYASDCSMFVKKIFSKYTVHVKKLKFAVHMF